MGSNKQFFVRERIFAGRLAHGPLDHSERLYREFLSCEFCELLELDPWLQTARPSVRGKQVLVPVLRRVMGHQSQLPVDVLDWVTLYRQLIESVLEYFDAWSGNADTKDTSQHSRDHRLRLVGV